MKTPSSPKGMTLIELMVAMMIVGLIFGLGTSALRAIFDADIKQTSSKLASTMRYLANKAVTDQVFIRMVIDIDGKKYRIEQSDEATVIDLDLEEKRGSEDPEKSTPSDKEKAEEATRADTAFSEMDSKLAEPVQLPSGVVIKDVAVSYLKNKKESGQVVTYFFPDGYATPTLVNLQDANNAQIVYSIELMAMAGRVKVDNIYRELER